MKAPDIILKAIVVVLIISACSTWQEPQIDQDEVEIFVPRDSLRTDIATQLFYWYHVGGAAKYELQIVSPNFDRIDRLVLDTNVSTNKLEFTLRPGNYEWSIRAYNNSSSTGYTVHTLFIDSTLDLGNQKVILISPKDRDTSNIMAHLFQWQDLYNADDYLFEMYRPNTSGQLVFSNTVTDNFINHTVNTEGNFEWRVRGINSGSQTLFSAREFFVDTTSPAAPVLKTPAVGVFLSPGNINFEWTRGANSGAAIFDTLYVATDSNFVNVTRRVYSKNGKAVADTLSNGIYYWGVQSFDKAGNQGPLSSPRQFTIQ